MIWVKIYHNVANGKPHPDIFKVAADRQNVPYNKCLVFEDAEAGFMVAKRANMEFVNINLLL